MDPPALADSVLELQQTLSSSCVISEPESRYHVFLSHAGSEKPFVHDLYHDFVRWSTSLNIFFDQSVESLPKGEPFPERILEAARNCDVAIVILSKAYVTSRWPMLELIEFVKAQKTTKPGLKLLPVFYNILPSFNIYDSWIAKWKEMEPKSGGRSSKHATEISVELCKEALRVLGKSNGICSAPTKAHRLLREEIMEATFKFLPQTPLMNIDKVQGCVRLCESIFKLFQKNTRGVYCLGLYGMGGLGKTTMCNELCNYFGQYMSLRSVCHVEIGSNETGEEMKLKRHIKILEKFTDISKNKIDCLDHRKAEKEVQRCLSHNGTRKFLAVDNIQDSLRSRQEAENYLKWLSPESYIIITSRSQDNLLPVIRELYCKPIPNLEKEEAMALFLKIAAPEIDRKSINDQEWILRRCLQLCFFSPNGDGGNTVNGESGHYHPLALQAVASYLRGRCTEQDPILCWEKVLKDRDIILTQSPGSMDILGTLGLGFKDLDKSSKQLFIDVALFAPPPLEEGDTFNWLVSIHHRKPQIIRDELRHLRAKSFLKYDDGSPSKKDEAICRNISMHDLYKEIAKKYIGNEDEGLFKYGVYDNGYLQVPSLERSEWSIVPRIRLQRLTNEAKVKKWCNVAVVHLVGCEIITNISIGELSSLRDLMIMGCPKLEVLSWTQDDATTHPRGTNLCFVFLHSNKSLRKIPDFSTCPILKEIYIEGCSSSVEPISLHTCLELRVLRVLGNDVPEVQSIQSCPKLRSVRLAWQATHKGLPLLNDLHCFSELVVKGPSVVPFESMICYSSFFGENQFWKQYPKNSICYELPGEGVLANLKTVKLTSIPMGKLPVKLSKAGSNLESLTLSGCLLSDVVDFSAFPNLKCLTIRWTNVKELRGLERLKKLEYLDCNYCFWLQKVPDLRPLPMLRGVTLLQCPMLEGIPRLPPGCIHDIYSNVAPEDDSRAILAAMAFGETNALPLPGFAMDAERISRGIPSRHGCIWAMHLSNGCDGCMMFPIIGPRYKAKPVTTWYNLCSNCFSKKCCCTGRQSSKSLWIAKGKLEANYDLCYSCYKMSGCGLKEFYEIDETIPSDQVPEPGVTLFQEGQSVSIAVSGSHFRSDVSINDAQKRFIIMGSVFTLKVTSSPFETSILKHKKLKIVVD